MKLIYAGQGVSEQPYTELLFNCIRNQKCERSFYVPVNLFSDIVLYADLPGEPSLVEIEVLNVCDIANIGSAVATTYVIGTKPDATFYGVFGGLVVTPPLGVTYNRFFFKFTFTIGAEEHVYYSEQYEFPYCEDLMFLRGCYPNLAVGTDAFDCNGIYYGFPNDPDPLGDPLYKYIHSAFLRMASIIEQKNKMTFTAFNNKRIYKSVFAREWLLEFELVPTFYKNHLIGIFNRGNVQLNGVEWKLADSQDISIVDVDSKLWKADILLDSECKQTFGCAPADCVLPVPCDPVAFEDTPELPDAVVGIPYSYSFNLTGTAPFALVINDKPAWMTIGIAGNVVSFTGTPDTEEVTPVEITISNCDDANDIILDQDIDVVDIGGDMVVTSTEPTLSITGIVGVTTAGISYPVTATVDLGTWSAFVGGDIQTNLSVSVSGVARLLKNAVEIDSEAFAAFQGFVTFAAVAAFADGDIMEINVQLT